MVKPIDQKAFSTVFIISILLFSGIFGAIWNSFSELEAIEGSATRIESGQDLHLQEIDECQKADEQSTTHTRGESRTIDDVGVVSMSDIEKDVLNVDHYPGTVVHMNITVKNFGTNAITTPFELLMTISDGTTEPPSYHFQENQTLPACLGTTVMQPETPYNLTWNWTTPLKMPHGCNENFSISDVRFWIYFTTLLEGDENSSNNQKWMKVDVNQPDFEVELQKGWIINNIYFPQPDIIIRITPGEANLFQLNFTLHNLGKGSYINFTTIPPQDWKAIPPPRKYYNDRSNSTLENLSLTIFPSVNRKHLPTATWLIITLKAVCESYPLAFDTIDFRVKVEFWPYPLIKVPVIEQDEIYKVPPGYAFINFKVYNDGNGEDNFETEAQVGETSYEQKLLTKKGWNAVVHSGKYTRILKRGEYQVVTVKITVPSMVRTRSPCPIKLIVSSEKDPNHHDGKKNNSFYVFTDLHKNMAFINHEPNPIYIFPDSEKTTRFKIRNIGNYIDRTIRVNVSVLPENWEVIIDSSAIPAPGLPINGTADIEAIVKTPEHVVESTYDVKIAVISNDEIKDEITIPVHVLKIRKIALYCSNPKNTGNVSEEISFIVTVENIGNSKDSVDLRYSYATAEMKDENWKVKLSKNFTTLYPYESRDVIVSVLIPLKALADTNFLSLNIQEGYIISIHGISQNDTTVTAEKEIEVLVNPIYDFSFSKSKDVKYLILHQSQIVDYTFKIENKGNNWDLIDIWPESTSDNLAWIYIPFEQRKLLPGVIEELTINFEPPPHLDAGKYEFTIYGKSVSQPTLITTLELTLEIIESDLELTTIQIGDKTLSQAKIKEGETVLIRVLITNVADLDYYNRSTDENVVIKFMEGSNYIGETNITYLPAKRADEENSIWVTHSWKIGKARPYTITVHLDPYEAFPESILENNELSGKVEVRGSGDSGEDTSDIKSSDLFMLLGVIIVFIIIMLIGIWLNIALTKRGKKKGYTETGEYKPYEETSKAEFDKEEEEEEPEGGILGVHEKHPYASKKSDKFMKEKLSIITMRPIKKTKPIKKSKPVTSLEGEGKRLAIDKPQIAGLLPPAENKDRA